MFRFFDPSQDDVITTRQLLRLLKVKVTDSTLIQTLQEHPDYPSLLSIADSLQQWKVTSMGVKVAPEQLTGMPLPLIAHFRNNMFIPVTEITDKNITYISGWNKENILSFDDFVKQWDGIVLLAEAIPSVGGSLGETGEPQYEKKHRQELLQQLKIPLVVLVAVLFILLNGIGIHSLFPALFSVIMLAGVIVTSLLLWYEIDKQNFVLYKICTAGKHTNCSAILQSGAAKLWGIISWSEIGFAWFTGGFLSLLISGFDPVITNIIAWLNLLAAPYILFSVYYQWRVAKQWCVLCLSVQGLLLTGVLINMAGNAYSHLPHSLSVTGLTVLFFSFSLPLLLWTTVKPVILKAREDGHHKQALARLKHDPKIFEALLPKQKMITESTEGLGITIGSPNAGQKLIKVCNPYCGPCARAHPEIEAILDNNPDIAAQIIFTATDEEKDIRSGPVKHLMAIAEKGNKELTKQALDDWYLAPKKDYDLFANKYPLNGELQQQGEKLHAMSEWCEKTGIRFTPTFFVTLPSSDGKGPETKLYQLPDIYSVGDLKYLIT